MIDWHGLFLVGIGLVVDFSLGTWWEAWREERRQRARASVTLRRRKGD